VADEWASVAGQGQIGDMDALATAAARSLPQQRRGVYRKAAERSSSASAPPAWEIGDKKSFAAARARAMRGILGDLELHGHEKAALAACFDHMNADSQWSCWASIQTRAEEAGVSRATCWRAIGRADGKHILTQRGQRIRGSQYVLTLITLHPNYVAQVRPSSENYVSHKQKLDRMHEQTRSHASEENLYLRTPIKEPIERDFKERGEKKEKKGVADEWPRHGARSEKNGTAFIRVDTTEWKAYSDDYRSVHGLPMEPDPKYGNMGRWCKILGEACSMSAFTPIATE